MKRRSFLGFFLFAPVAVKTVKQELERNASGIPDPVRDYKAEFIEKLVRPPIGANHDLRNEPSSIIPGRITYISHHNGGGFWPLFEVNPKDLKIV